MITRAQGVNIPLKKYILKLGDFVCFLAMAEEYDHFPNFVNPG